MTTTMIRQTNTINKGVDAMKTYQITVTRHFYGPVENHSRYMDDDNQPWVGSHAEARAKIDELNNRVYYLSHNEYTRPDYRITDYLI